MIKDIDAQFIGRDSFETLAKKFHRHTASDARIEIKSIFAFLQYVDVLALRCPYVGESGKVLSSSIFPIVYFYSRDHREDKEADHVIMKVKNKRIVPVTGLNNC